VRTEEQSPLPLGLKAIRLLYDIGVCTPADLKRLEGSGPAPRRREGAGTLSEISALRDFLVNASWPTLTDPVDALPLAAKARDAVERAGIVERSRTAAERRALAREFDGFNVDDRRVSSDEVAGLVREACERPNGWKVILARCAPPR